MVSHIRRNLKTITAIAVIFVVMSLSVISFRAVSDSILR